MIETAGSAGTIAAAHGGDSLDRLVCRIATGDRSAFRCLYAFLAVRVWRASVRALPHATDARAVTRSTFVEVWHLARRHVDRPGTDTRTWLAAINTHHVDERLRAGDPRCPILGEYDRHTHRELVALLGAGPAMIRTSPTTFVAVDDLAQALSLFTWDARTTERRDACQSPRGTRSTEQCEGTLQRWPTSPTAATPRHRALPAR